MRRYLLPLTLLLAFAFAVFSQLPTIASPQGDGSTNFMPVISKAIPPTPTPEPTFTPIPEPTSTPSAATGNGVFKRESVEYFDWSGTKFYGFVRFFDGSPAWGGPNNFHVWVSLTCGGVYRSSDLDGSGYYQIPINGFPADPLKCPGQIWVTHGPQDNETRVSQDFSINTENGSCVRADFIECTTDDPDAACQYEPTLQALVKLNVTVTEAVDGTNCP